MEQNATILELLRRPIAYHAILAKAFDSVNLAVMWSQLYYWTPRANDENGWIYKSQDEMHEETGLSRRQQEKAREIGRELGVLEDMVRGTPPTIHYRVMIGRTVEILQAYLAKNVNTTLFPALAVAKEETPGDFARRFFSGDELAEEQIKGWLTDNGVVVNEAIAKEIRKFKALWTEPNKSGKKVRWELERTFDVRRRIATWLGNAAKWGKSGTKARGGMRV